MVAIGSSAASRSSDHNVAPVLPDEDSPSKHGVVISNPQVTTADGAQLHVTDYQPTAPEHTVVLLHGLCADEDAWAIPFRQLIGRWGDKVRIIAYDHRGHGDSSDAPMRTYRVEQLAEDLAQVLTKLRVNGPLTIAGHSMGGMTALAYLARPAAARPVDPHSVVLVGTAAGKLTERGLGRLLATPAVRVLGRIAQSTPRTVADGVARILAGPMSRVFSLLGYGDRDSRLNALVAKSAAAFNATGLRTKAGFLRGLQTYDEYSALDSITADTTVISGGTDKLTPPEHAHDLADGIPNATHLCQPNAGHMLLDETPGLVTEAISNAIRKSRRETAAG